jgi:hypothetical protein
VIVQCTLTSWRTSTFLIQPQKNNKTVVLMPENGVIRVEDQSNVSQTRTSGEQMKSRDGALVRDSIIMANYNQVFISKLFPYLAVKPGLKPRASGFPIREPGPSPLKARAKPCLGPGLRGPGRAGLRALSPAQHITSLCISLVITCQGGGT